MARKTEGFPDRLHRAIRNKGLRISDVAAETPISVSGLNKWLGGHARPQINKLRPVADFLNVSIDWLIGDPTTPGHEDDQGVDGLEPASAQQRLWEMVRAKGGDKQRLTRMNDAMAGSGGIVALDRKQPFEVRRQLLERILGTIEEVYERAGLKLSRDQLGILTHWKYEEIINSDWAPLILAESPVGGSAFQLVLLKLRRDLTAGIIAQLEANAKAEPSTPPDP